MNRAVSPPPLAAAGRIGRPSIDLDFEIRDASADYHGITPQIRFALTIRNRSSEIPIRGISLHTQIQIACPQRSYEPVEKERLSDLFGSPDRWGQTLRHRLWTQVQTNVPAFKECVDVFLPVPCSFDLNLASAKYFDALRQGEVPLLFLFSGTVFYLGRQGGLQVEQISWDQECEHRMPLGIWKDLMDAHYPNSAWLYLRRDLFDRLHGFKRRKGLATWDQAVEQLLNSVPTEEAAP